MTFRQDEASAQAPCSSTMVGLPPMDDAAGAVEVSRGSNESAATAATAVAPRAHHRHRTVAERFSIEGLLLTRARPALGTGPVPIPTDGLPSATCTSASLMQG